MLVVKAEMVFIEVYADETETDLAREIADAYVATYNIAPPCVGFGRVIVWEGRLFREVQLPEGSPGAFVDEDRIFGAWKLPDKRARMQVGSSCGMIFTIPPQPGEELVARIKEGGRCGRQYTVKPFQFADYRAKE